jgi:hypothetical protein
MGDNLANESSMIVKEFVAVSGRRYRRVRMVPGSVLVEKALRKVTD